MRANKKIWRASKKRGIKHNGHHGRRNILTRKTPESVCFQGFGGGGGIRTHEPLRATWFRVRLVMTTSIHLRGKFIQFSAQITWFRVSPVMTTSIPLRVFFATSALKKHPGKRRELQKFFSLMIPPKPWKIKGFQKQFQSGHSFSIQPCYDHFDTAACIFATSALKKHPGKRRELQNFFSLMIPPKP